MKVRLLLIGFGFRGRQWADHARRRRKVTVAGVVDSGEAPRAAAEQAGMAVWPSTEAALADASSFDAALIATPPADHAAAVTACLQAGLAVLVEKPPALTLRATADLAREAEGAGRPLLVAQNFRFLPRERAVASALADGRAGSLISSVIESSRPPAAVRPAAGPIEERALWDFGLHHLDALRVRFGMPERIYGETSVSAVSAALNWAGGLFVDYRHDDGAAGYRYDERMEGPDGAVVVADQRVTVEQPGRRPHKVRAGRAGAPEEAVLDELAGALAGKPTALSAADNLLTMAVVEGVSLSARLRRPVTVDEVAERAGVDLPGEEVPTGA